MGSAANRLRKKWQDYSGKKSAQSEHSFYEVFSFLFQNTEYEIVSKPTCFKDIYVKVKLTTQEVKEVYHPNMPITQHGIQPDFLIKNKRTGKTIYGEIKRQDGWVEGKPRSAGRGNAHERLCKYFTPGLLKLFRKNGKINSKYLPFWIIFQGDITRDPCRVREIKFWFGEYTANYFFWRNTSDGTRLVSHFEKYIIPILE